MNKGQDRSCMDRGGRRSYMNRGLGKSCIDREESKSYMDSGYGKSSISREQNGFMHRQRANRLCMDRGQTRLHKSKTEGKRGCKFKKGMVGHA